MKEVSRDSSSHRFSSDGDRRHVFEKLSAPRPQIREEDDWIDLYQLLGVPPDASTHDLDEAIIARGADAVYFAISRAGKPPHVKLLEKYLHDMRPILLDPTVRHLYDEQLNRHKNRDPHAMRYEVFKSTLDIREQSGSCIASLILLIGAPFVLWSLDKMVVSRFI